MLTVTNQSQKIFLWFIVLCSVENNVNGVAKWKQTELFTWHLSIQDIHNWYNFSDSKLFRQNYNELGIESPEVPIFGRFTEQEKSRKLDISFGQDCI